MKFGCLKSKYDGRDILMMGFLDRTKLPDKYEIELTPVKNQGKEGACTGFAGVGMKEWQEKQDYEIEGPDYIDFSERFLYNEAKKLYWGDRWQKKQGADLRSIVKVLEKRGVCEEKFAPYKPMDKSGYKVGYHDDAEKYRIETYARITSLRELKESIYQFGPCIIGWLVFKSIRKVKSDGIVPDPNMWFPRISAPWEGTPP